MHILLNSEQHAELVNPEINVGLGFFRNLALICGTVCLLLLGIIVLYD